MYITFINLNFLNRLHKTSYLNSFIKGKVFICNVTLLDVVFFTIFLLLGLEGGGVRGMASPRNLIFKFFWAYHPREVAPKK